MEQRWESLYRKITAIQESKWRGHHANGHHGTTRARSKGPSQCKNLVRLRREPCLGLDESRVQHGSEGHGAPLQSMTWADARTTIFVGGGLFGISHEYAVPCRQIRVCADSSPQSLLLYVLIRSPDIRLCTCKGRHDC